MSGQRAGGAEEASSKVGGIRRYGAAMARLGAHFLAPLSKLGLVREIEADDPRKAKDRRGVTYIQRIIIYPEYQVYP